ncbi:MAG: aspartate/glutamate racemase family protein [Bacteroidales bacterium]|nr:aspartate/glutamate racemase family protein [Bacteroidales bacterium]
MKTIGLIGGTGWISTADYYKIINETVNEKLKGLNFAKCVLYSFNYGEIIELHEQNNLKGIYNILLETSAKLEKAGADCILLCANTLHMFADELEKEINVPLIHIAKATAKKIKEKNISVIGLLGTKQTMEKEFYKEKLKEENIESLIPPGTEREFIHNTITGELLKGIISEKTKSKFIEIIGELKNRGARGIVLGCTEIPLLIKQSDVDIPVFNTTLIHSEAAVEFALNE